MLTSFGNMSSFHMVLWPFPEVRVWFQSWSQPSGSRGLLYFLVIDHCLLEQSIYFIPTHNGEKQLLMDILGSCHIVPTPLLLLTSKQQTGCSRRQYKGIWDVIYMKEPNLSSFRSKPYTHTQGILLITHTKSRVFTKPPVETGDCCPLHSLRKD